MPHSIVYSEPPVPGMQSGLSLLGATDIRVDFQRGYHEEVFTHQQALMGRY